MISMLTSTGMSPRLLTMLMMYWEEVVDNDAYVHWEQPSCFRRRHRKLRAVRHTLKMISKWTSTGMSPRLLTMLMIYWEEVVDNDGAAFSFSPPSSKASSCSTMK